MTRLRILLVRIVAMFQRRRLDQELETEIQAHIGMQTDDNIRNGMGTDAARLAARRSFGGIHQVKEHYRDQLRIPVIETFLQDLRYADEPSDEIPASRSLPS